MAKMRVFELAKEFNMPSKQLIQAIKGCGVIVETSFNVLAAEQVEVVRRFINDGETPDAKTVKSATRKRVVKRDSKADATVAAEATEEKPAERPRRIRKARGKVVESSSEGKESAVLEEVKEVSPPVEAQEEASTTEKETQGPERIETEKVSSAEDVAPLNMAASDAVDVVETQKTFTHSDKKEVSKPLESNEKPKVERAVIIARPGEAPPPSSRAAKRKSEPEVVETDSFPKDMRKRKKVHIIGEEEIVFRTKAKKVITGKEANVNRAKTKTIAKPVVEEVQPGMRIEKMPSKGDNRKHEFEPRKKSIKVGNQLTVGELAGLIGVKASDIIKKLMFLGTMATINQSIPGETAALIAAEFKVEVEVEAYDPEEAVKVSEEPQGELKSRDPVVTIMGHVDHGKTSLLDKIRSSQVATGEAGGITQHIGAYHVETNLGSVTFLDTPGHEAFTAMRARGANLTDIVILVVAADDSVQPQTIEAIHHAQAAEVPIIVAVNKVDKPDAQPERVEQDMLEHGLVSENLGGETIFVKVSAKSGDGISQLLEMIHLQAEMLEIKASYEAQVRGVIIESRMIKGRGPVGTVLIQQGVLSSGDHYVVGNTHGKVRALMDEHGKRLKEAKPSIPVEILGFNEIPEVGQEFVVVDSDKKAREIIEKRLHEHKEQLASQQKMHLEDLFNKVNDGENAELCLLIKADVQGSAEALQTSLVQLSKEEVRVRIIHSAAGNITETDVMLASASNAVILGFNTKLEGKAREASNQEGVDVRMYSIIYDAIDDVTKSLSGLLKPKIVQEVIGHCEVRKLYDTSKGRILGCYVTDGKLIRNSGVRVLHKEEVVFDGTLQSLKRFKDDVKEVLNNYECGVGIEYNDVEVGDVLEAYLEVEQAPS